MHGPATYQLDERLLVRFNQLTFDHVIWRFLLILLAVSILVGGCSYALNGRSASIGVAAFAFGAGLVSMMAIRFVFIPITARRRFREYKALQEEMTLSMGETAFRLEAKSGVASVNWADMVKWDEDDSIFAVHPTLPIGYIWPKSQVPPAMIDYARDRLIRNGLPRAGKKRK